MEHCYPVLQNITMYFMLIVDMIMLFVKLLCINDEDVISNAGEFVVVCIIIIYSILNNKYF